MEIKLEPQTNFWIRVPVLMLLLVPIAFSTRLGLVWRILSCFMPLMLAGTYRITVIRAGFLETKLFLGFIPVRSHRCRLSAVVHVGTRYGGSEPGIWTFLMLGPIQWIFGWIFDFLIPAIGGPYEIWVETAKGREFIVWQGFAQQHFEKNVDLLCHQSGAEIKAL